MIGPWRSLRVQLAVIGFVAMYLPVLALLGVSEVTEHTVVVDGVQVTDGASTQRSSWTIWTAVALGPTAAGVAWWLAGRAVRPMNRIRTVAEDIEATDLSRRIGLDRGPKEIVALATSFDAMLDRLEYAADVQRRLIEETSHELRTPLAVLTTNADVLLAHPAPTVDVYREGLERSREAAHRLQTTIVELLVDARGRSRTVDRRPADLAAIASAVVGDATVLAAAKDVALRLSCPEDATCSVDEPMVRRALANLVDNAVRAAPDGSSVDVAVEMDGTEARLVVVDRGPGIPPDQQPQVFERFWQGRPDGQGAGLGLPIARQVALAHGGDLTVRSPGADGSGCIFVLRLRQQSGRH